VTSEPEVQCVIEAMRGYAEGKRTNNTEMVRMMEAVSPDERDDRTLPARPMTGSAVCRCSGRHR